MGEDEKGMEDAMGWKHFKYIKIYEFIKMNSLVIAE